MFPGGSGKKVKGHNTFKAAKIFLIIIWVLGLVINNMSDLTCDPKQARGIILWVKDRDTEDSCRPHRIKIDKRIPRKHLQSDFLFIIEFIRLIFFGMSKQQQKSRIFKQCN